MSQNIYTYMPEDIIDHLSWKEDISTVKWCKDNICLTVEASPSMPGWISFNKTPWIEDILNDWDLPYVTEYNILASTQVGKTTIIFCCAAKDLDTNSGQMQFTIPTDDGVSEYVSTKFDPFVIDSIPSIKNKIVQRKEDEKKRLKGALKEVPNGKIFILGNTDKNRRSKSVTRVFIDEAALFGSGHIDEILGRMKFSETLNTTKAMIVSSLKFENDEMQIQYNNSYCKKELKIQCPSCEEWFYPTSNHFKYMGIKEYKDLHNLETIENLNDYKREARHTGRVECECGHKIYTKDIHEIVRQKKVKLIVVEGSEEDTIFGYKLNALASGLTKYETIVEKLIKAEIDGDKLSTIYQDYFNEIYQETIQRPTKLDIRLLGNGVPEWIIPKRTIPNAIYMGVDTQKDHFWVKIKAYQYGKIGNTIFAGRVETLNQVEDMLRREIKGEDGKSYYISKLGIDRRGYVKKETVLDEDGEKYEVETQNNIDMVDEWCMFMVEKYGEDMVYPTMGKDKLSNDMTYQPFNLVKDFAKTRKPIPLKAIRLSNIELKKRLQDTIDRTVAKVKATTDIDKGYYYQNRLYYVNQTIIDNLNNKEESVSTDYDRQMTSEILRYPIKNGKQQSEKIFEQIGRDNHLFDCDVICEMFADMDRIVSLIEPKEEENASSSAMIDLLASIG